jgi:hypothetical protein
MIRLPFTDRAEAGRLLAAELVTHKLQGNDRILFINGTDRWLSILTLRICGFVSYAPKLGRNGNVTLAVADRISSSDQGQSVIENDGMPVNCIAGVLIHQVPEVL